MDQPVQESQVVDVGKKPSLKNMALGALLVVLVLVLIVVVLYKQGNEKVVALVNRVRSNEKVATLINKSEAVSTRKSEQFLCRRCGRGSCRCGLAENLADPESNTAEDVSTLHEMGYVDSMPWSEVLATTELDPSVSDNHSQFVADVRRFSSGANFTSVADDNTTLASTNFVGLRRPQHVHIGGDARQQPDVDETVLERNRDFRW